MNYVTFNQNFDKHENGDFKLPHLSSKAEIVDGSGMCVEGDKIIRMCMRGSERKDEKWLPLKNIDEYRQYISGSDYVYYVKLYRIDTKAGREGLIYLTNRLGEVAIGKDFGWYSPKSVQAIKDLTVALIYLQFLYRNDAVKWKEYSLMFQIEKLRRSGMAIKEKDVFLGKKEKAQYIEPVLADYRNCFVGHNLSKDRAALILLDLHTPNINWYIEEKDVRSVIYKRNFSYITSF